MTVAKNTIINLWSKAIPVALLLATIMIFLPLVYHFGVATKPLEKNAINGQVLIKSIDLSQTQMVSLAGGWSFFWQQLLSHEEALLSLQSASTLNGSGGWQAKDNDNTYHAKGYATYHLTIVLQDINENLALRIPHIETAYDLYVDNDLVASGGIFSEQEKQGKPGYNSSIILLPQGKERLSLTLHVSNYHSIWGGLWSPIILGDADSIYGLNRDRIALSMFILGSLLIAAIHSLILFYLRSSDKTPLVFACLCLILFLREMTNEDLYFALSSLNISFSALLKLNYLTFYAGMPVGMYFIQLCYSRQFDAKITRYLYLTAILFSIFVLLSPVFYMGYSMFLFQFIALAMMGYTISKIFVAATEKQVGAKLMMIGVVIICIFALNDILYFTGVITSGRFLGLGIVGFIICQSYVANNKFGSLITNNQKLTIELKERNADLEIMSSQLETKVEQRTQQLRFANLELKQLANADKLTDTLNRHGIQQHLTAVFERYRRTKKTFSIVLLDYDDFKMINDKYGHDVGDIVLKVGSNTIKECVREQDKVARWGGEEFLVLLPDTDVEGALAVANKIRISIQDNPFENCPASLKVTVTGGVGQAMPDETFETIFKRADMALYKGKNAGKNCIYD